MDVPDGDHGSVPSKGRWMVDGQNLGQRRNYNSRLEDGGKVERYHGQAYFHSNRGSQYASNEFTDILKEHKGTVVQSISRKGNCRDNAVAESFFKSLKVEWMYHQNYNFRSEAERSIFQWIETWYNRRRIHSTLHYRTMEEFENEMYNQKSAV